MRISQFIEKLTEIYQEEGDIQIRKRNEEGYYELVSLVRGKDEVSDTFVNVIFSGEK